MLNVRHQCMIYRGAPSLHLQALAVVAAQKLRENRRCLYLDSPPMVAGMRCYLSAVRVDVEQQTTKGSLVLSSDRSHLVDGRFDMEAMLRMLEEAVTQALKDGYAGLWAAGDMTWELGPQNDFSSLLEYEWRLEEAFQRHPQLSGICMYHGDTLPAEALADGLHSHQSVFINETLSRINPYYIQPNSAPAAQRIEPGEIEEIIADLTGARESD
jgi:hypothetical protein